MGFRGDGDSQPVPTDEEGEDVDAKGKKLRFPESYRTSPSFEERRQGSSRDSGERKKETPRQGILRESGRNWR